jgi:DNA-binding IclR family transcriptional regulator
MEKNKKYFIQSVDRALSIIEILSKEKELGVTELSKRLNIHKSTIFSLLGTLQYRGYISQNLKTGKYQLSLKLFEIGHIVFDGLDLLKISRPYLEKLLTLHEETVHLVVLDNDEIIYIDKIESSQSIKISSRIGSRLPVHCTGVGKAMIAFKSEQEIKEIIKHKPLKRFTSNTITNYENFLKELQKIRRQGYAMDNEEFEQGLICVAAPIKDIKGNVIAALSIAGPTIRMNKEKIFQTYTERQGLETRVPNR